MLNKNFMHLIIAMDILRIHQVDNMHNEQHIMCSIMEVNWTKSN